jgi:hypothetical protein
VDGNRTVTAWFQRSHYLLQTTILPNDASGSLAVISGTRTGNPSVHVCDEVLTLGVVDTAATIFQKWENDSRERERTVTMDQDHALTATFVKAVYIKVINDTARGTVTIEGAGSRKKEGDYYVFAEGDPVSMSANPTEHYDFDYWTFSPAKPSDATADDNAALTFTARDSVDITALFTEKTYTIKVTAEPAAGAASIMGAQPPAGDHDFLVTDTTSRLYGSTPMTVTVTPKDEPGVRYRFNNWDGNGSLTSPSRVWNCDGNAVWVAHMQRQARVVVNSPLDITTYAIGEPGGGSITVSPGGGGSGEYRVDVNGTLTVTLTPAAGYEFAEWRGLPGVGASTDTSTGRLTLAIDTTNAGEDIVLTPCFRKQVHQVTVRQWNQTTGTAVDGGGISISPDPVSGENKYLHGTVVTVRVASVYSGYRFMGWDTNNDPAHTVDVPATGDTKYTFTITGDTTLHAVFKSVYRLTLSASPAGAGTVAVTGASNASKFDVGPGVYEFDQGTTVTIKAAATGELSFSAWFGEVSSMTAAETTVTMTDHRAVTAVFELVEYRNLIINVSPAGKGTVSVPGESALIAGTGTITRHKDASVLLTAAVTDAGYYQFTGWSGASSDTTPSTLVTLSGDGDKVVTANFAPALYEVTARPQVAERGTVTGSGTYGYNAQVTLSGSANPGYRFVDWITETPGVAFASSGTTTSSANPDTFRVPGATVVQARFEPDGTEGVLVIVSGGTVVSRIQKFTEDDGSPIEGGSYVEEIRFSPDAYHKLQSIDGDSYFYEELSGGDLVCRVHVEKGGGYKSVSVVFYQNGYLATAECIPAGTGDLQINLESGSSFPRGGQTMYTAGSVLRFIANEKTDGDHVFKEWRFSGGEVLDTGANALQERSVRVRVTGNVTAEAYFEPKPPPRTATFRMNFVSSRVYDDARIIMGGVETTWGSGTRTISAPFLVGGRVVAECVVHDAGGNAAEFIVDGWVGVDALGVPATSDDATFAKVEFTMQNQDVEFTVNITETRPILSTRTHTDGDEKIEHQDSYLTDGGEITPGGIYDFGDEVMLWVAVNPGFDLATTPDRPDGWGIKPGELKVGGHESLFVPFEPDPAKPGTFGEPHPTLPGEFKGEPDAESPGGFKLKLDADQYPGFREYAQDMDGNYIVPGTNRTLIIKWTDPAAPAPADPAVPWRWYGKRVHLNSAPTTVTAYLADPNARRAGVYYLETDSPRKLDGTRDKSGNILIHGEVDESLRRGR